MRKLIVFMALFIFFSSMVFSGDSCQKCHKTPPNGEIGDTCKDCHPAAAKELQQGKMKFLSCVACHGTEHHAPGMPVGDPARPAIKSCEPCHKNEVELYKSGKHYEAWPALTAIPAYNDIYPHKASDVGCVVCHQIGQGWPDGTRGRCDYCHTPHLFSQEEARKPETCRMCHAGDQPQYEAWANSMHGAAYDIEGDTGRAPTCVTCHGGHDVITAWGFLGLRGEGGGEDEAWRKAQTVIKEAMDVTGLAKSPRAIHSYEEWQKLRTKMIKRCSQCHAEGFVKSEMEKNDQFLRELDLAEVDVINEIKCLFDDKLLDENSRMALYYDSIITRIGSFIGAYHGAPSFAWDHGFFKLYPQKYIAQKVGLLHDRIIETKGKVDVLLKLAIVIIAVVIIVILVCFILLFKRRKKSQKSAS
jgi:hydroxylamine dehydrogenase